ncbi:tRNA (adenosine(37)-N6)-dimethylallyltransferase MiaA [Massilicoli timonensis]|uniref:tRNA (adenosine(37)-N6)-dimethylallyltransferase MiaA n=1 Tax=Massilicoli timonensis TaxID=2015901 RepID=UPI003AAD29B8
MEKKGKIVTVVGTNASGKSDLAVYLAKKYNGEIISADSRQIYRGYDLGTGKLSKAEMQGVVHHMIDILDSNELFSVADFQARAYACIDDILSRGKLPIIAGGTGLYVRSVVKGYTFVKMEPDLELREELEKKTTEELYAQLAEIDEQAAKRNTKENRRRIIRALEKYHVLGKEALQDHYEPRYEALQLGVTWPNAILHERIDVRMKKRFDEGMIEEVKGLMEQGATAAFMEALGLEYRHIYYYLSGRYQSKEELYTELSRAIKRFAKQQKTWFRKDHDIIWLDMEQDYKAQAEAQIEAFLHDSDK